MTTWCFGDGGDTTMQWTCHAPSLLVFTSRDDMKAKFHTCNTTKTIIRRKRNTAYIMYSLLIDGEWIRRWGENENINEDPTTSVDKPIDQRVQYKHRSPHQQQQQQQQLQCTVVVNDESVVCWCLFPLSIRDMLQLQRLPLIDCELLHIPVPKVWYFGWEKTTTVSWKDDRLE